MFTTHSWFSSHRWPDRGLILSQKQRLAASVPMRSVPVPSSGVPALQCLDLAALDPLILRVQGREISSHTTEKDAATWPPCRSRTPPAALLQPAVSLPDSAQKTYMDRLVKPQRFKELQPKALHGPVNFEVFGFALFTIRTFLYTRTVLYILPTYVLTISQMFWRKF